MHEKLLFGNADNMILPKSSKSIILLAYTFEIRKVAKQKIRSNFYCKDIFIHVRKRGETAFKKQSPVNTQREKYPKSWNVHVWAGRVRCPRIQHLYISELPFTIEEKCRHDRSTSG